jgi:DNA-binding transcriptional ArsR family regulator
LLATYTGRSARSPKAASEAVNAPHLVPLVRPGAVFKNDKLITRLIPSVRRMPISEYDCAVARAATTSDVFNAIAEPQRREILALLRAGERPVTQLAQELGMTQPGASKHLRVLREVGLVRDRKAGKQRLYGLDARGLRPVHEWTGGFERFWNESFDRLDAFVQDLKQARQEE